MNAYLYLKTGFYKCDKLGSALNIFTTYEILWKWYQHD